MLEREVTSMRIEKKGKGVFVFSFYVRIPLNNNILFISFSEGVPVIFLKYC